jgi:glycosyltransferase involved in cell wall biosynthesis
MTESLDIVIPVYREEENITHLLRGIRKYVKTPNRLLVVWQDRNDPTVEILKQHQRTYPSLRLLECKEGIGIVNALRVGYGAARAPIIITMMADLSDDPRDVDKMVKMINAGLDVVSASRYMKGGKRTGGPVVKGFLSFFACWTLSHVFRFPTTDATNAFRAFRKSYLETVKIESVGGFELPLELTVKARMRGLRIGDVPTVWHERATGKSKFKLVGWLPQYLRWYMLGVKSSLNMLVG